jgi:hypothetical protein
MMNVFLAIAALVTGAGLLGRRVARVRGCARTPAIMCALLIAVAIPLGIFLAGMETLTHYYDWQRMRSLLLIIPCCWGLIECAWRLDAGSGPRKRGILTSIGMVLTMIVLGFALFMEVHSVITIETTPPRTITGSITRIVDQPRAGKTPAIRQIFLNRTCYNVPNATWFTTLRPGDKVTFVTDPWGNDAFPPTMVAPTRMGHLAVGAGLYLTGLALVRLGWAIRPPAAVAMNDQP